MNGRRQRGKRARHGTRDWVLKVLESADVPRPMRTSEIRQQVAKLSGRRIPDFSLYHALRTLVRRKAIRVRRVGREHTYQPSAGKPTAPAAPKGPRSRRAIAPRVAKPSVTVAAPTRKADAETRRELHKLAMGDIVILKIGDTFVEVATNLNGRLVLERHPRPM